MTTSIPHEPSSSRPSGGSTTTRRPGTSTTGTRADEGHLGGAAAGQVDDEPVLRRADDKAGHGADEVAVRALGAQANKVIGIPGVVLDLGSLGREQEQRPTQALRAGAVRDLLEAEQPGPVVVPRGADRQGLRGAAAGRGAGRGKMLPGVNRPPGRRCAGWTVTSPRMPCGLPMRATTWASPAAPRDGRALGGIPLPSTSSGLKRVGVHPRRAHPAEVEFQRRSVSTMSTRTSPRELMAESTVRIALAVRPELMTRPRSSGAPGPRARSRDAGRAVARRHPRRGRRSPDDVLQGFLEHGLRPALRRRPERRPRPWPRWPGASAAGFAAAFFRGVVAPPLASSVVPAALTAAS